MSSDPNFRTTPNGRAITMSRTAEGASTFKATPGGFAGLVVASGFTVEIDGARYVEFTASDIVWLTDAADGIIYIVAEPAIGGRQSRLLSLPEARIDELYGVIVGRYVKRGGHIVADSLEDLNDFFCPEEPRYRIIQVQDWYHAVETGSDDSRVFYGTLQECKGWVRDRQDNVPLTTFPPGGCATCWAPPGQCTHSGSAWLGQA